MTTQAVPHGTAQDITTNLATTPTFDVRQLRSFLLRASASVTVSVFASQNPNSGFKAVKVGGSTVTNLTLALVDEFVSVDSDIALAIFGCHYLRFVAGAGTPTVELMGKA
jgi:hypothetical protein